MDHSLVHDKPGSGTGDLFNRLLATVIRPGMCTHCGTCVGLSEESLEMKRTSQGPIPSIVPGKKAFLPSSVFEACPGKGVNYPALHSFVFGQTPKNWLLGSHRKVYVGYSRLPEIRKRGASGGILTQTLLYLLGQGLVDAAVVVRQGSPMPYQAEPIIARSADEIRAASQSVYVPVPVNQVLAQMTTFEGTLAYVGLPDQVASLRCLQRIGHPAAQKVRYVLGPYVGTSIYLGAIESYLRSNGVRSLDEILELRYREGDWPGHLQIRTRSGKVLKANKFYYNYLIPFYITRSSLFSVDFTNELTDISVGDAWHPRYEARGEGFSVVVARSESGEQILTDMEQQGLISLEEISLDEALSMHGHMLDFKKRGAFIRLGWRESLGKPVPHYGYWPRHIPLSRKLVEVVISSIFAVGGTRLARRLVEFIPIGILGPAFDTLRKTWKSISKPTKRKGLRDLDFEVLPSVIMGEEG
jgi:coenzyme F420 hydrogenase subunit beta